ncbi:transmembrane protease serine 9-like [Photinus pyralis]|uniref:transmembrane protease serine 9-like n=1 Tax=Photinus pyralis TaxID=7054 RepID=UPI00126767CF|nr:transmembrane protease serine 9-like [Photinus pyralis]
MFRIVLVALFAALAVEASPRLRSQVPQLDGRIVGGVDTTIEDYPHQVSLLDYIGHVCGGSIIARNLILTAAHCTYGMSAQDLKVRYGSSVMDQGGTVVSVVQINQHPRYNPVMLDCDVSVLKLAEDVVLSSTAQIIEMVPSNTQEGGRNAFVSGWGALYTGGPAPTQLQVVEVAEEDRHVCSWAYGGKITDRMICFKNPGKDACQGDSGGPLISGGAQVGVVSWGYACADARYPGVYSHLNEAYIRAHIVSVMDQFSSNMFKIVLVAVFAALAVEASPRLRPQVPQLDGRIVGGVDTTIEDYPHQISLMYFGNHICGGSIIARNLILTAAHCNYGQSAESLEVRYGSSVRDQGGIVVAVDHFHDHPDYNPGSNDYDVSVLKLAQDVVFSSKAQIIEIPPYNAQEGGRIAFVSGWGALHSIGPSPNQLQVVEVAEEDRDTCNKTYNGKITDRMICFRNPGKDTCQGDSGGPLVSGGVQIGVVSWGYGCAHVIYPGVYSGLTNVALSDHILGIMGKYYYPESS